MSKWKDMDECIEHAEVNGEDRDFIRKMMDYLREAPTIDIVRCEECKRWENGRVDFSNCKIMGIVKPDDFCSYGSHRENRTTRKGVAND